jgi:hypothetical protein
VLDCVREGLCGTEFSAAFHFWTISALLIASVLHSPVLCPDMQEPESVDKDVLRRWYVAQCDPYNTALPLPEPPADLIVELSRRYVTCSETYPTPHAMPQMRNGG